MILQFHLHDQSIEIIRRGRLLYEINKLKRTLRDTQLPLGASNRHLLETSFRHIPKRLKVRLVIKHFQVYQHESLIPHCGIYCQGENYPNFSLLSSSGDHASAETAKFA